MASFSAKYYCKYLKHDGNLDISSSITLAMSLKEDLFETDTLERMKFMALGRSKIRCLLS